MTTAPDQSVREQALAVNQSFIVQAPAGSGKTELLTQRYLKLLTVVTHHPEEILAITFTRKAASEMRARIMAALHRGQDETEPTSHHQQLTWQLARAVLQRNDSEQWQLLENPHRLRITTIDAFCASLTQQMPVLAGLGPQPEIVESAHPLYQQAVALLLQDLEQAHPWQSALSTVLRHVDNRFDLLETLFISMLARREQWLDVVMSVKAEHDLQAQLAGALQTLVHDALHALQAVCPSGLRAQGQTLLAFARDTCPELPTEFLSEDLSACQQIADWLLTAKGQVRKSVTARMGFPAGNKDLKTEMQTFLLALTEHETFVQQLDWIRHIPAPEYQQADWEVLEALLTCLPVAVGYLRVVFAEQGQVDFTEMSLSAQAALGSDEAPTDLALRLDYRLQHILVDEFQDTSDGQFRLLLALTRGWQTGDGRSVFLVGDPMQSIYRFRQAEVGLFIQAMQYGLGSVTLTPLQLTANFRSAPTLVQWFNDIFCEVFPAEDDMHIGAVAFRQAQAVLPDQADAQVKVHWVEETTQTEADQLVAQIQAIPAEQSIAILVRSRAHLSAILPALQRAEIAYHALDLETLAQQAVTQDLCSLLLALQNPQDRLHWFALLRAPWAGLSLTDLTHIADASLTTPVFDVLSDDSVVMQLSADGHAIVQRILPVLQQALEQVGRHTIRMWLESTWVALQGPATLQTQHEIDNAYAVLDLLEQDAALAEDHEALQRALRRTPAKVPDQSLARVEVMTIHKSKGLEFDVVLLPGLARYARPDTAPLLLWQEYPVPDAPPVLLLAPIKAVGQQEAPLYRFLQRWQKQKAHYEQQRLLYVAATRAKRQLHLFAEITRNKDDAAKQPAAASMLALLWPQLVEQVPEVVTASLENYETDTTSPVILPLQRLPVEGNYPEFVPIPCPMDEGNRPELPTLSAEPQRQRGIVIHALLARIATEGLEHWSAERVDQSDALITMLLQQQGYAVDVPAAVHQVQATIKNMLKDDTGKWVLQAHPEHAAELPLTVQNAKGSIKQLVIDRTFLDSNGVRWIIDYKTTDQPQAIDAYLPQLETYHQAWKLFRPEEHVVKLGVYFTAQCQWISL